MVVGKVLVIPGILSFFATNYIFLQYKKMIFFHNGDNSTLKHVEFCVKCSNVSLHHIVLFQNVEFIV